MNTDERKLVDRKIEEDCSEPGRKSAERNCEIDDLQPSDDTNTLGLFVLLCPQVKSRI